MVKVKVDVTLKEGVLDPKGVTITQSLQALGYKNVKGAKVGKIIELDLNSSDKTAKGVETQIKEMSERLLANPVIEDFDFKVEE